MGAATPINPHHDLTPLPTGSQNGLIPGTKEKAKPKSGAQVTVYELTTGKPLRRVELSDPAVRLLADTGKGLLLQRNGPTGVELVRLDIAGGKQETVSRITGLRDFTVAGGVLSGWT